MSEILINIEGISKKFCRDLRRSLWYGVKDIANELAGRNRVNVLRNQEFWALKDVSLRLHRGEALGLVGSNGSGKTTLLRIISGLIKPDAGFVECRGRIAPLIALGAGFNPILTGRENTYANMSILGLSTQEIDKCFDDVVEFAGIGDAISAPVQSYSSGMAARLGFACAIHTHPEILLIDEVLSVGDISFRAKCFRKLNELRQAGTSFIMVNHNPQAILNICDSAAYLSKGQMIQAGSTSDIVSLYERDLFPTMGDRSSLSYLELPSKLPSDSLGLDLTSVWFEGADGTILETITSGEDVSFCINFRAYQRFKNVHLHLKFSEIGKEGNTVLFLSNGNDDCPFEVAPGDHQLRLELSYLNFIPGMYSVSIKLKEGALATLDFVESFRFGVEFAPGTNMSRHHCLFNQQRAWTIRKMDRAQVRPKSLTGKT